MTLNGSRRVRVTGMGDNKDDFVKIGVVSKSVAKEARIDPGNIVVSRSAIAHISQRHLQEINAIGITPADYVAFIAKYYNRIYLGSGGSYLLVVHNRSKDMAHVAAIRINYSLKKGFWEVVTAQPRLKVRLKPKDLKWEKQRQRG